MAGLLDESWSLGTADLIQQNDVKLLLASGRASVLKNLPRSQHAAAYIWLNKGDEHKDLYLKITGCRILYELYNRVTSTSDVETYKAQCIGGIVEYIKAHPKASEEELTKEVEKHVKLFKQRIESL